MKGITKNINKPIGGADNKKKIEQDNNEKVWNGIKDAAGAPSHICRDNRDKAMAAEQEAYELYKVHYCVQ
jgi:hypothetical protein